MSSQFKVASGLHLNGAIYEVQTVLIFLFETQSVKLIQSIQLGHNIPCFSGKC